MVLTSIQPPLSWKSSGITPSSTRVFEFSFLSAVPHRGQAGNMIVVFELNSQYGSVLQEQTCQRSL